MEHNFTTYNRNNRRGNNSRVGNNIRYPDNPFFSESPKKREEQRNIHHKNIINVFQQWFETSNPTPLQIRAIDIQNYDLAYIENTLKLEIGPNYSSIDFATAEEMALSHLKDKKYKKIYDIYAELVSLQNDFNKKCDNFIDSNLNDLEVKIGLEKEDEEKVYDLFLYYLVKADDVIEWIDNPDSIQYRLYHLESLIDLNGNIYSIQFPEKIENIRNDISSRYKEIIKVIEELNKDLIYFGDMIGKFKDALKPIIDNGVLGIKGKCSIEEQLSLKGRIKSFLHVSK